MVDFSGAIWMPVPEANVFPGYEGHIPRYVCIHKTASPGTAQDIAAFFQTVPDRRSSHYIVGQDGTIVQCVSESDGSGANCCPEAGSAAFLPAGINMNLLTISIEHVDPAPDNSTSLTPSQQSASFRLVHDICQRHAIPMRTGDASGGIIGHNQIAPLSRARCPGNYPMTELLTFLQQGGTMSSLPTGWIDDGHTLSNPVTSFHVVLGFRDYILNYPTTHGRPWDSWNVPLESQVSSTPLEISNPALGGGDQQAFRATVLEYTPARGVFEMWVGQEFLALRALAQPLPPVPPVDPRIAQYQGLLAQINTLSKI